jgi:WD40 repeat protein
MRTRYLIVFLLLAKSGFSQVTNKDPVGCIGCFSEPQSTLLFGPAGGDTNYGSYTLVTPNARFSVPQLSGPMERASSLWAISPSGDRIAGGITFMLNADLVKCDPKIKGWCDPKPKPIFKSVMGVYSVRDKTWKQYGNFQQLGSPAFSPDEKRIAFYGERHCTDVNCESGLMILDIETSFMKVISRSVQVDWRNQISWSPDGKFFAVSAATPGFGRIVVFDVDSGKMRTIAQGTNPSWSPKGDWIAYQYTVQCMIIRPDGKGARSVFDKEHKWMKDTLDAPIIWSPDGEKLLLNQRKILDDHPRVIEVDLGTGHVTLKSKNGEMVMGWVPYSGK